MDNTCPDCQNLVTAKHQKPHGFLSLISTLPNSQLYKCTSCYTYLYCSNLKWEVLMEGYDRNSMASTQKPSVAI
jgi:hypothetical protein